MKKNEEKTEKQKQLSMSAPNIQVKTAIITPLSVSEQVKEAEKLFLEKNFEESMSIYINTIGEYDSELVICKFFTPETEKYLISYLFEVHKKGFASKNATSLLFSLFIKYDLENEMNEFISLIESSQKISQSRKTNSNLFMNGFDTNTAISALNASGYKEEARRIAIATDDTLFSIELMIKEKRYVDAATRMFSYVNEKFCKDILFMFGHELIKNDDSAAHIVCQAASMIYRKTSEENIDEYVKLFWGFPKLLADFLKDIITESPTKHLVTLYIELLIPSNDTKEAFFGNSKISDAKKAVSYIRNKDNVFDERHILNVCSEKKFLLGFLSLMSRQERSDEGIQIVLNDFKEEREFYNAIIEWGIDDNTKDLSSDKWYELLSLFVEQKSWNIIKDNKKTVPFLKKAISKSLERKSVSIISNTLLSNENLPVEIYKYGVLDSLKELAEENATLKLENNNLGKKIGNKTIYKFVCASCGKKLSYPCTCFMCGHTFHKECSGANEAKCPICSK